MTTGDAINEGLVAHQDAHAAWRNGGPVPMAAADYVLAALADAGFVVVACPPGEGRYVKRESKPCPDRHGGTGYFPYHCETCRGSGVVEATTTYGLEAVTWLWSGPECSHIGGGGCRGPHWGQVPHTFRLVAVALPEDGE